MSEVAETVEVVESETAPFFHSMRVMLEGVDEPRIVEMIKGYIPSLKEAGITRVRQHTFPASLRPTGAEAEVISKHLGGEVIVKLETDESAENG